MKQIIVRSDGENSVLIVTNELLNKTLETTLTLDEFNKIVYSIEQLITGR